LTFKDRKSGQDIFHHWREELGKADVAEYIRLVIVKGIDRKNPHAYRIIVGVNPNAREYDSRLTMFICRIQRMEATTSGNLDHFLKAYDDVGALILAPAFIVGEAPQVDMDLAIGIHHVFVRNAWEIGPNDIDSVAIQTGDHPIIPKDVKEPPVLKLIRNRRK
jgi:hypothetical protein